MANLKQTENKYEHARLVLTIGIYSREENALQTIEKLLEDEFPADRLSLLRKAGGLGDDMLGLAYINRVQIF